jgi:hypothetical protein
MDHQYGIFVIVPLAAIVTGKKLSKAIFFITEINIKKMKKKLGQLLVAMALYSVCVNRAVAQNESAQTEVCRTSEMVKHFVETHPEAKEEQEKNERFTEQFISQSQNLQERPTVGGSKYIIPCVFHVYGTTQGGKTVNLATIQTALANWVNKDFKGLNSDFGTVHSKFFSIRDTLSIEFALAKKDPDGNATTGVLFYSTKSGYGNDGPYDSQIQKDAWDNYSYFNIYIMNDLYADGSTGNSGVCWYPSTTMSDKNLARCVYNGAYLGNNTSQEFASVLTHEFGHFLNLIHTFEGGCGVNNDNVNDTPTCAYPGHSCHTSSTVNSPLNCNNQLINAENYMDYSGAYGNGCYKMFTQGQVARMKAALDMPSRVTLWQTSNLIKTGILTPTGIKETNSPVIQVDVFPNPAQGKFNLRLEDDKNTTYKITVSDVMGKNILTKKITVAGDYNTLLDLSDQTSGIYFLSVSSDSSQKVVKLMKE